ncbi:MAG TPA: cysteine desulfurase family protein [Candidatus Polarisedimenticolaceae bacterium]|nr:cysteine desulfurase family protein [Candidatus Polarisedimenticolaceae bacterium]
MRTYLDHNATSPLRPEARRALDAALDAAAGNPSSLHQEGRAARALVEKARAEVAALSGASPGEVVFTSGGSEGIAAALHGAAGTVVVSAIEHSAVLEGVRNLDVILVPCERSGRVDAGRFIEALRPGVSLAAIQAANNETGVLQPVEEIATVCRDLGIPLLVDAVQAAGKIPIPRADLVALSGHKLGAPQGTGALIVRDGLALTPLIAGGAQERRRRGGTEAVALIAAFGAACAATKHDRDLAPLRDRLEAGLPHGARVHGASVPRVPNTTSVTFPDVPGETLVIALDLAGVAASTGSACASGAARPSHVLRAMGEGSQAVRFSLGWSSTERDVDTLLGILPGLLARATMAGR